jgi:hypothetical protein
MNNIYYDRHHLQRLSTEADQSEIAALRFGTSPLQAGIRDDLIAGAMDDFDPLGTNDQEKWQSEDIALDDASVKIADEIIIRKQRLGDLYPFSFDDGVLEYSRSKNLLYEFLLCASTSPSLTTGRFVEIPRTFERISAELIASYLGRNAGFRHIGWPRNAASFRTAMEAVHQEAGEWAWRPQGDLPEEGPRHGDEGVDFVIWKKFGCGRLIGQQFYLGQCACGNDWNTKFSDVSIDRFGKWFDGSGPLVKPSTFFSVPFVVVDPMLRDGSRTAGVIMDRIRLIHAANSGEIFSGHNWIPTFEEIIDAVIH